MTDSNDPRQLTPDAQTNLDDQDNHEDSAEQLAAELDGVMATWLDPIAPSAELLMRLQATVARPPHRYAPFFKRVADLFDLPETTVIAELSRFAEPRVWRFAGLPGVHNIIVRGGPGVEGAEVVFARFAPGTRFPGHRHTGVEKVLVLEGNYVDSHGVEHRAGELREWPAGTNHAFRVDESGPCIIASVVYGREFEALPLRWLSRILGR